jgi:hypothetical protein
MLKLRFKKFLKGIKTALGTVIVCSIFPRTVEAKIPIPGYYQTVSLQQDVQSKSVSLEDVQSKSDSVNIRTTKHIRSKSGSVDVPTAKEIRHGKHKDLYWASETTFSNFKITILEIDGEVENIRFEATLGSKLIPKKKKNNYNNENNFNNKT